MSYERLAYDDQDSTVKMTTDCTACVSEMGYARQRTGSDAFAAMPSVGYPNFNREIRKPEITVSDAAMHLASRIHLHLN